MTNESSSVDDWRHTRRIMTLGFAMFLALIGIAIAGGIFFRLFYPPVAVAGPYPFFWGFGFFWPIFGLFFLFFVLRWMFWPWRPYRYGYYRRLGYPGTDDAISILRARYARGELTKEQFDQMMRDLQPHA